MVFESQFPLLRFLILFIAGILFAVYVPLLSFNFSIGACIFLTVFLLVQYIFRKKILSFKYRWSSGIGFLILSPFLGYTITLLNTESRYLNHFRNFNDASASLGYVEEPIREKDKTYRSVLNISQVKVNDSWCASTGNCLVYFLKDSAASNLHYGDLILFKKQPSEVRRPSNPSQFNYKKRLRYNKIFDEVHIPSGQWTLLSHHQGNFIYDFAFSLREKLLRIFRKNGIEGQDYAVLSALILGYEDEIDRETINAYAASGTLHVLSVSGLHVGIIYLAFNFLLGFLNRRRDTRIFKCIVLIFFLWFYALLTGLSPPVLRSALMLTFIVGGELKERPVNLFNALIASAFFLLCYNPYMLMNVGFQLSYLAVAGIVLLNQRINQWWEAPNWILKNIWDITTVSLSAQLATFPLGLLYFHQFPNYFLLSNLAIIPLSSIIIYGGILLLIFSWWTVVAKVLGFIMGGLVHFLNYLVFSVEQFPYALIRGISISVIETILIYIFIAATMVWLIRTKFNYALIALSTCCVFLAFQVFNFTKNKSRQYFVVYDIPKKSAINFIDGTTNVLIADTDLIKNKKQMLFNIHNFWWDNGLDENKATFINDSIKFKTHSESLLIHQNFYLFNTTRFVKIDKSFARFNLKDTLESDFVILSDNVKGTLHGLVSNLKFKKIIIDSSNSMAKANEWLKEADEMGASCFSVLQQGAFVLDLSGSNL